MAFKELFKYYLSLGYPFEIAESYALAEYKEDWM